jgi:hypothetical protein
MVMTPGVSIEAPLPIGRRYGLFDAAAGPLDLPEHGEAGGVRYVPVTCGDAVAYGVTCYTGEQTAPDKPLDSDNPEVETGVFAVLSTLLCNAVGYTVEELRAKVRRRLEGAEMAAVERALWTGLDLDGNTLNTQSLDDEAVAIGIGYDPDLIADVVGALERYAYTEQGYGGVAYLHAPIEVAAFAAEAGLIVPESSALNARKRTPAGSVWAFGAYPAGEVIVTGQTTVWRAPDISVYQAFENATNEQLLVAERTYAASFECFAGRATYDPLEVTSP